MKIRFVSLILLVLSLVGFQDAIGQQDTADSPSKKPLRHRDRVKTPQNFKSRLTSDRSEESADRRTLEPIGMGMDKVIDLETDEVTDSKNITIGNSAVASYASISRKDPESGEERVKQLVLKGVGEGETNLMIRNSEGEILIIFNVTVAKQNVIRMFQDLKRDLKEVEGMDIRIEGNRVVLEGEVLTPNDYGKVANVISDAVYKDVVSNRVTMSPVSLNALSKKIEQDLKVLAESIRVSVLNGKLILEGTVESEALKIRASKRAEWYLPTIRVADPINKDPNNIERNDKPIQLIQNDIQVTPPQPKRESKLVRLSIHIVELSKDFLKKSGFKWQPGFTADPSISIGQDAQGGTATPGAGGFTFAGTLSSLFPTFTSVPPSASFAKVLKSVVGIVKSQEQYSIKDQQRIPTVAVGANGQTGNGSTVDVGMDIKVTPTILQEQDVDMNISLAHNQVIGVGVNGTPITGNHEVTTRIYLKSGEVGGVTSLNGQDMATGFNRDDANSGSFGAGASGVQTKPLFTLLRSKSYTKKRGQFVVFVSPQIIESASEGTEDLKRNYRIPSSER